MKAKRTDGEWRLTKNKLRKFLAKAPRNTLVSLSEMGWGRRG